MLSSILCVMRPIHSALCLLIVKMYAPVLKGCLIDVSLVKQWLLDSFVRCLTPSYYSYLRLKGLIKCLCAPLNVTISPEQQASFEQKLFLCIREREKQHIQAVIQRIFPKPPSGKLLARNTGRREYQGEHTPVIAGIKLKRTAGFIAEPG